MDWNTIGALAPRLATDARIRRHIYRGVPWYVVQDGASARHVRLAEGAWRIAGLMDGRRTLEHIRHTLDEQLGAAAPGTGDIVRVLSELHAAELLECDALDGPGQLERRRRQDQRLRWRRLFGSPFSQRIPLLDPQAWLDRWLPVVRPLFGTLAFVVWIAVVIAGVGLAIANSEAIAKGLTANELGANALAMLAVAYLVVKTLHELGHAFATRAFGGEVHEMGVMFLVFLPVPYVDASASSAFEEKSRRMAVGAAGIMVEVFLSVVALAVWLEIEPGPVRDFVFNVMLVGGVSTVLFNGNPLLRFDGYYVLCDALEIPNLGLRSTRYLGYLVQRYLGGAREAVSPVSAPGEGGWFLLYGLASFFYRVAILVAIVLFVAGVYLPAGIVLGVWAAISQWLLPAVRGLRRLIGAPVLAGRRVRTASMLAAPVAVASVAAAGVPVPAWTYAEGIVWMPDGAQVRAGASGFLVRQFEPDGAVVESGDPLFELDAARVHSQVAILERRLEEHQARYDAALFNDRAQLEALEQQLARVDAELAHARDQVDELVLACPLPGRLVVPDARRLEGRYVRKGEMLGYVSDGRALTARVVVRQDEIDRVRDATRSVRVKLAGYPHRSVEADIATAFPSATRTLPGAALGVPGGGRIPVDGNDPEGTTAADSVFVLDITLPPETPRLAVGTRVYLRFEHGGETLAAQAMDGARRLLRARFEI